MAGPQLKALAGIAPANQLFLESHGHDDDVAVRAESQTDRQHLLSELLDRIAHNAAS